MTEAEATPAPTKSKPKKPEAVKKAVTKKPTVKKTSTKSADSGKSKAPPKKAVKPKPSTTKATKPKPKAETPAKKLAKGKPQKRGRKPKKAAAVSQFNKFETLALEAVAISATDEKPYVSSTKIRQYLLDYEPTAKPGQIPRYAKLALASLVAKKILKPKKESYTFTLKGKDVAPEKVQSRKKIVRPVKPAKKSKKTVEAVKQVKKPVITLSGRTSKPLVN
jgi:hypothetical protein